MFKVLKFVSELWRELFVIVITAICILSVIVSVIQELLPVLPPNDTLPASYIQQSSLTFSHIGTNGLAYCINNHNELFQCAWQIVPTNLNPARNR